MSRWRFLLTAVLAVAGGVLAPATSRAAFLLKITASGSISPFQLDLTGADTGFPVGITGGGSYTLGTDPFNNRTVSGTFGNYTFQLTATNNVPGTSPNGPGTLVLTSVTINHNTSTTADAISISLTGTGYTNPTSPLRAFSTAFGEAPPSGGGVAGNGTDVFTSIYDPNNNAFGVPGSTSNGSTTSLSWTTTPTANQQSNNQSTNLIGAFTYSLTNTISITNAGSGRILTEGTATSNVANAVAAPAPSGLILAAGALPFVGVLRRKFRAAPKTAA
jgi:hypothetical protein